MLYGMVEENKYYFFVYWEKFVCVYMYIMIKLCNILLLGNFLKIIYKVNVYVIKYLKDCLYLLKNINKFDFFIFIFE